MKRQGNNPNKKTTDKLENFANFRKILQGSQTAHFLHKSKAYPPESNLNQFSTKQAFLTVGPPIAWKNYSAMACQGRQNCRY
jgi:hypothetical protein